MHSKEISLKFVKQFLKKYQLSDVGWSTNTLDL